MNVKNKVVKALEEILKGLAGLEGNTRDEQVAAVEEGTFRCAGLGILRVKTYWQFMQGSLGKCLRVLESDQESEQNKGELIIPRCRYLK